MFFKRGDRSAWYMMTYDHFKSSNELIFGELKQSRLIMERNFEG